MKSLVFISFIVFLGFHAAAQNKTLGVGTATPNQNAALHVESPSANQGMLIPRLTTSQRNSLGSTLNNSSDVGIILFDTDLRALAIWNGTSWDIGSKAGAPINVTNTSAVGSAAVISTNNTTNNSPALLVTTNGGPGNSFNAPAILATTSTAGSVIIGRATGGSSNGIHGISDPGTDAGSYAVIGQNDGLGNAGVFSISNASNIQSSLRASTSGTGSAGEFQISNATSASPVVTISSNGTGNAIEANRPIQATAFIGDGSLLTGISGGSGWSLTGNSSTVDGTNFIGTTDDIPLSFKVNNQNAGRIDQTLSNTFFGYQSGNAITTGGYNVGVGLQALFSNVIGTDNTALGTFALHSNTGSSNTAVGTGSMYNNTFGNSNVSVGAQALSNNTTGAGNSAFGNVSLSNNTVGISNVAIGNQSFSSNVAGSGATAIGTSAMQYANNTASPFTVENVAVGFESLRGSAAASANTGNQNTAIGYQTLWSNTTGSNNSAVGDKALYSNTTGNYNTANGQQSLFSNTVGAQNTAYGYYSLLLNTTGDNNTAVGRDALASNVSGISNTAVGYQALYANTIGTYNTSIGWNANVGSNNLTNAAAIGANATVTASNMMVLGDANVTKWGFGVSPGAGVAIQVGDDPTNGNGASLTIGGVWTNASDKNKKENFASLNGKDILDKVNQLSVMRWNYKGEPNISHIGPMAQDFYRLFRTGSDDITISTIDPAGVALVAIQELTSENEALKKMIAQQQLAISKMEVDKSDFNSRLKKLEELLGVNAQK